MNRPALLVQCIEAIVEGDLADFEVLAVDQSRDESTRRAIEARFGADPRIRYLHSDIVGSSHARNVGIAESRGPIVAFVDDDAIPVPSWLSAYVEAFQDIRPAPGLVGGRITLKWDGPCPGWYPEACKFILGTIRHRGSRCGSSRPATSPSAPTSRCAGTPCSRARPSTPGSASAPRPTGCLRPRTPCSHYG